MKTSLALLSALTLTAAAHAQTAAPLQQNAPSQPAPIVRGYAPEQASGGYAGERPITPRQIFDLQPAAGVSVRGDADHGVETVTISNDITELRLTHGRADVTVHHPANRSEILVDLPGSQVALLKDGFYTFNAQTNTVRVLHGEAEAFAPGADPKSKGAKIREDQQLTIAPNLKLKAVDAEPYEIAADVIGGAREGYHGEGYAGGGSYAPYGYGAYVGYPVYGGYYGYPYGYGFAPYGFGYPYGFGIGVGYYRGFGGYRGGFGGYRGGFRR